jgi:hypothetical protein
MTNTHYVSRKHVLNSFACTARSPAENSPLHQVKPRAKCMCTLFVTGVSAAFFWPAGTVTVCDLVVLQLLH